MLSRIRQNAAALLGRVEQHSSKSSESEGMRTFHVYNQVLRISHIFTICVSTT